MDLNSLDDLLTILIALSVASERLVEIVKGFIPWLSVSHAEEAKERRRRTALQILAVLAGVLTAILARSALADAVPAQWSSPQGIFALGLLASGGSGFWNAILGYVKQVKEIKKVEATAAGARSALGPNQVLGALVP